MENGPFEDVFPIENEIFHCHVSLLECNWVEFHPLLYTANISTVLLLVCFLRTVKNADFLCRPFAAGAISDRRCVKRGNSRKSAQHRSAGKVLHK